MKTEITPYKLIYSSHSQPRLFQRGKIELRYSLLSTSWTDNYESVESGPTLRYDFDVIESERSVVGPLSREISVHTPQPTRSPTIARLSRFTFCTKPVRDLRTSRVERVYKDLFKWTTGEVEEERVRVGLFTLRNPLLGSKEVGKALLYPSSLLDPRIDIRVLAPPLCKRMPLALRLEQKSLILICPCG